MTNKVHSKLGASGAERWMACPGSVALIQNLNLTQEESVYAAEGTAAHDVAEWCLSQGKDAYEFIGQKSGDFAVTRDMATAVQQYVDYCRGLSEAQHTQTFVEEHVSAPEFNEAFFGTVDFAVIGPAYIHIVDYKHGAGLAVDVKNNKQLLYYAFAFILHMMREAPEKLVHIKHVGCTIVQPRGFHQDGTIRECWYTLDEVVQWGYGTLAPAMETALPANANRFQEFDLHSGKHCIFCPARLHCSELRRKWDLFLANKKDVKQMTNEELVALADLIPAVVDRKKAVENELFTRMQQGQTLSGYKLIAKRSDRTWKEDALPLLEIMWGDEAYEKKLKSPAQVEKDLVGGADFTKEWAFKPDTGLTVAAVDKPGVAVQVKPVADKYAGLTKAG